MRDARKKLFAELKPRMVERGYKLRLANDLFWRTENDFIYHWQTRCLSGSQGVEIEPAIGIRSETIERIFHQTSTFAPQYHSGTSTIGASLVNLEGVGLREYRCPITTDDDVLPVVERLMVLFETKAIPYFERYRSLEAIDHLLNDQLDERVPGCSFGLPRETRGLIVAKLVDRPNYQELVEFYRSRIVKVSSGFHVPQFEALVVSLEALQPAAALPIKSQDAQDSENS
jgi:hypothetical protein